jgi:hypothetical protein
MERAARPIVWRSTIEIVSSRGDGNFAGFAVCSGAVHSAILTLAILALATAKPESTLDPRVEALLANPSRELASTPGGFRIIALSNFADYCMNEASIAREDKKRCLSELVKIAKRRMPGTFAGNGLYLSHLNIVLGAYEKIAGDGKHRALQEKISRHLAKESLSSKTKHAASFPGEPARWPADQTATLYSLHLYDEKFAAEVIEEFLKWMDKNGISKELGLPKSEVTRRHATSELPRGCALSFMVRYMAPYAPERAKALWEKYRDLYTVDLGVVVGLREWPPGVDRKADSDSGPIVRGIGVAASGFGIGAARAVDDDLMYARLVASAALVKSLSPALEKTGANALATAIELAGRSL